MMMVAVVGGGYSLRAFLKGESTPGPEKSRQVARVAVGPILVAMFAMMWVGQLQPERATLSYLLSVPLLVVCWRLAWLILHEPTEADALANFAHDREHCGRCGY